MQQAEHDGLHLATRCHSIVRVLVLIGLAAAIFVAGPRLTHLPGPKTGRLRLQ